MSLCPRNVYTQRSSLPSLKPHVETPAATLTLTDAYPNNIPLLIVHPASISDLTLHQILRITALIVIVRREMRDRDSFPSEEGNVSMCGEV